MEPVCRKPVCRIKFVEKILQTGPHFSTNWILQTVFLQTGSIRLGTVHAVRALKASREIPTSALWEN